ncbi:MAG: transcription-repair coupling factor [Cryomorphaceae bacterium]|nr:transcription-repair coupling factor [Cryomorphaceae bacterium]
MTTTNINNHLTLEQFTSIYEEDARFALLQSLRDKQDTLRVDNVAGSQMALLAAKWYRETNQHHLFVLENKEEAAYFLNDMEHILGDKDVLFFPASHRRPYAMEETDNANVLLRAEVLNRLNSRRKNAVIVTYPEAIFEKVIAKKELNEHILPVKVGDSLSVDFLNETLFAYHFDRVDFVTNPGEFSVRGGIIDVFSFAYDHPYRIELFGDEVDSIRLFDIETQLSIDTVTEARLMPNVENKKIEERRVGFLDYLGKRATIHFREYQLTFDRLNTYFDKATDAFKLIDGVQSPPDVLFNNADALKADLHKHQRIGWNCNIDNTHEVVSFGGQPPMQFNKNFDLLVEHFQSNSEKGLANVLLCSSPKQVERFYAIFEDLNKDISFSPIVLDLHGGFTDSEARVAVFTDHEIFERFKRFKLKNQSDKQQSITLKELNSLKYGDFVAHIDHGIGRFGGLQKIENDGKIQEAIKLVYRDNDVLYVSIHALHKIARYNSKEGTEPSLHKLGSGVWQKKKAVAKSRIKTLAFDLIQLYAKRKATKGFAFSPDTYLQHELEASFIYEDTPDQLKATADIKADMENETPMDRLICGDVGFGKTELAIRAAFKAVTDGKQVAVLVPTTILAFQHYKTFKERLKDFPVNIDYINRFKSAKKQKETLSQLNEGRLDIIIGTHRIVNKDVVFKDLGLLIVDEEQKFGVNVKDKLKTMRVNVDTLTLTATPIPRTLQFSLMAARDLSVMTTPPPNRHPIDTQLVGFNEEMIRDTIMYEIRRGGQVFFINNRVNNILEVAGMIQRLCPDVKVGIGHGQMEGKKLENVMLDFMEGGFDVLVATSIIENGLDVPNANTIIINDAQNFGLSDLHQMRGRVGRSNKKAFCKLITPPLSMLSEESRKRLRALERFTDLGSGFQIAMKDLEIRGAGNLLGGEQSGFMDDIGFETYQKILQEAIDELKENEFKDLYAHEQQNKPFVSECQIDTDAEILFPDEYINKIEERLKLYQTLDSLENTNQLDAFERELIDRFGPLPKAAQDLMKSMHLRWLGRDLGFEKLVIKRGILLGYFVADQQSTYYQSEVFAGILQLLKIYPDARMKEKNDKLMLRMPDINNIQDAMDVLMSIQIKNPQPTE